MAADAERVPETAEEILEALRQAYCGPGMAPSPPDVFSTTWAGYYREAAVVQRWLALTAARERARVLGPVSDTEAAQWWQDYGDLYAASATNALLARRLGVETPPVGNEEVEGSG